MSNCPPEDPHARGTITPSDGTDTGRQENGTGVSREPALGVRLLAKSAFGVDLENPAPTARAGTIEGPVLGALLEVFSEDLDPEHAIARTLEALGENLGCEIVARWTLNPATDGLRLAELWHAPPAPAGRVTGPELEPGMALGAGLAGRVGRTGKPAWIKDALAFPIVAQGHLLGVIELFSSRFDHPDAELLRSMATVGERLGAFLERVDAEDERVRLLETERSARIRAELAWAQAERVEQRLAVLAEAGEILVTSLDSQETLHRLTQLGAGALGEMCVAALVDDSGRLRLVAGAHRQPLKGALLSLLCDLPLAPCSAIAQVVQSGVSRVLEQVDDQTLGNVFEVVEHRALVRALGLGPIMIVPLTVRRQTIGVLIFSASAGANPYDAGDVMLAEEVARRAAVAVDNAGVFARTSEVAHILQQSLLPSHLPGIPGVEIAVRYHPAGGEHLEVGGDFYDAFSVGPDTWGVIIGDAAGKGPAAAAMTALVRHTARTAARHGPPLAVPAAVNDALLEAGAEEAFCTMIYGQLRTTVAGISLEVLNCGHPAPLVLRSEGLIEEVESAGYLLGQLSEGTIEPASLTLRPGDALVLVTDGVLEARAPRVETTPQVTRWFGNEGLRRVLIETRGASAATIAGRIQERAVAFSGGSLKDDLAVLVLRIL